MLDNALY